MVLAAPRVTEYAAVRPRIQQAILRRKAAVGFPFELVIFAWRGRGVMA
jgi:hypothetical protein